MSIISVSKSEQTLLVISEISREGDLVEIDHFELNPEEEGYSEALEFYENQSPAIELSPEEKIAELRREFRTAVFGQTIDKLNPIWFANLGSEERAELELWRQAWLDYPAASAAAAPPDLPAVFGGQNG